MHEVRGVVARSKGEPVGIETVLRARPRPGRGAGQDPGLRRLPHRPPLPGRRDQRRLPLPPRPRGGRVGRGRRRRRHRRGAWRLRDPQLAGGVRPCRSCRRGKPWYCFATHNATQKMTLADGTVLSPALGIGAFAEKTLVAAGQCTKVDPTAPPTAAGLLGCGVMAGLGAAINTGGVEPGDSSPSSGAAVSATQPSPGRTLAGATTIIAVDIDDRKLELGQGLRRDPHRQRREGGRRRGDPAATGGNGADVCIEAIGLPQTYRPGLRGPGSGRHGRARGRAPARHDDRRCRSSRSSAGVAR